MGKRSSPARRLTVDISLLRESVPYRALLSGHVVSMVGTQMRFVAMAWHVFLITGSSVGVGLLGLAELVPLVLVSMFAGTAADTFDRKLVMRVGQIGSMCNSVVLAVWALTGDVPLGAIYAFAALGATFESIDRPARAAMIPRLVGESRLAEAMTLRQIFFQMSAVVGPAVGGVLVATLSLGLVYLLDGMSFLVALWSLRWLPSDDRGKVVGASMRDVVEGVRYAVKRPLLRAIFVADLTAMIFGMPRAVFPALAGDVFGRGAGGVGLLFAAPAVGAFVAALMSGWVARIERQGLAIFLAILGWGLSITLAGMSTFSLPLLLLFLACAGGADVVSAVFRGTVTQQVTPDRLRGRVAALNSMVVAGGPRIGDFEAGLVAGLLGPAGSMISGGLACMAGIALLWPRATQLARYRRPAPPEV